MKVEVEVNITEDPAKVKHAVENIFGSLEFEEKPQRRGSLLTGQAQGTESLARFGNLLRRERIRDAARKVLFQGLKGDTVTFFLNKQVAYVGHVSFCEPHAESPLGPIKVEIRSDKPSRLVDFLTPRTTRAKKHKPQ